MSAASQSTRYWNTRRRLSQVVLQTILMPWSAGLSVTQGALYSFANATLAYTAGSTGVTGSTLPSGDYPAQFSDGVITWTRAPLSALVRLINGGDQI